MRLSDTLITSCHGRIIIYWGLALILIWVWSYEPLSVSTVVLKSALTEKTKFVPFAAPVEKHFVQYTKLRKTHTLKSQPNIVSAIDINTATAEELCKIRGIGPVLAERIVLYRSENGKYESIADLDSVKGIGEATIRKIESQSVIVGR